MYLIKPGKHYDFMAMRKYFLMLSIVLLTGSVITFFVPGPKWGTDFRGGTEIVLEFKQPVTAGQVREAVESIKDANGKQQFASAEVVGTPDKPNRFLIRVQEVSAIGEGARAEINKRMCFADDKSADCTADMTPNEVKFSPGGEKITMRFDWALEKMDDKVVDDEGKTERSRFVEAQLAEIQTRFHGTGGIALVDTKPVEFTSARDKKVEVRIKAKGEQLIEGIKSHFGPDVAPDAPISSEWIGEKAGSELRNAAFKSIGIAMFFIMAYIAFRFDLRFAPGAVVALVHDVAIAIGAMCVARKEITLSTVAAILTILGYSLTDTVIVYDRVRENLGKHRGMTFSQIVNLSVSEMFGRTIITSSTAFVSMLAFLFFGTQVIKDFAFVMLVGISVGTYSSIYVAAPFTEWVDRMFFAKRAVKAKPSRTRGQRRADAVV